MKLWERGIRTWHHFLKYKENIFSPSRDETVRQELEDSIEHREDIRFFGDRLSSGEMWRLFAAFKEKIAYLDIETSGGYQGIDEITVIGLYDGRSIQSFVNGINLDEFEIAISQYDLVITFNGTTFDLPLIRGCFPNISLPPAHIDLRFLLKKLGYQGGLKKIEKDLDLIRDPKINGMNGYDAVMLWKAYQWGDKSALETLTQYNTADIVNLKPLMEFGYKEMKAMALSPNRNAGR
jgi:uncharacterized protein YprB with RNaseH-like and TPR domain